MKQETENSQKVRPIIAQMNKSSVGMAWSSNVAAGVARPLGMDGGDATRQINVHTQASVGTREMYSTFT